MTRTTKADLTDAEDAINRILAEHNYPQHVRIEWAYGKPRAYLYENDPPRMYRELSPRLSTGPMLDWLDAFIKGIALGAKL
jgi:hypothetical protein